MDTATGAHVVLGPDFCPCCKSPEIDYGADYHEPAWFNCATCGFDWREDQFLEHADRFVAWTMAIQMWKWGYCYYESTACFAPRATQ